MRIDIRLTINSGHARNPYQDVRDTIAALQRAVDQSTPATPALGGALKNQSGETIGSYVVEFPS